MTASDSTTLQVKRTTVWAACLPGSAKSETASGVLVWGAGYAAWATMDNAGEMRARRRLDRRFDDDPNTVAVLTDAGNFFTEDQLEERAYFYRRNRDLSILGFLVAHGLQVLDANTGAMLRNPTRLMPSRCAAAPWGVPPFT